jgi:hypothetical protein
MFYKIADFFTNYEAVLNDEYVNSYILCYLIFFIIRILSLFKFCIYLISCQDNVNNFFSDFVDETRNNFIVMDYLLIYSYHEILDVNVCIIYAVFFIYPFI